MCLYIPMIFSSQILHNTGLDVINIVPLLLIPFLACAALAEMYSPSAEAKHFIASACV